MVSENNNTFHGWAATSKDQPLKKTELPLKQWDEDSVEIEIAYCGMCGSDADAVDDNWSGFFPTNYPVVPGHEITGKVTRVGKNVTHLKVGDRAGVGAQCYACNACDMCETSQENLCEEGPVLTYNQRWPNGDVTYGGFADKWRGDHRFVFKVPDNLPSEIAATFFCAGITTFAPLKRTQVGPGSVVGVVGIGGLGHYGILWAKAMGAKAIGLSHSDKKRQVALELGCDDFLAMNDETQLAKYRKKLTHVLCTGTGPDFDWSVYLNLMAPFSHFINVMIPEWKLPPIDFLPFNMAHVYIHGSLLGSPKEIQEMLEFATEKDVRPWIQVYPMKNINQVLDDFRAGKPRFRYVLKN